MTAPLYWQIAQELRQAIESGRLQPGERLPTEPDLRETYGASRNTVRDAVKWLASRGLVESRPGLGTFVAERGDMFVTTLSADPETGLGGERTAAFSEVTARSLRATADVPRVEVQRADGVVAERLHVPPGTTVLSRHQRRYIDDTPWSIQTTFYPMDLVTRGAKRLMMAEDLAMGTVRYLRDTLGLAQIGYRDRLLVRLPSDAEASFFRLADDGRVSVVVIDRTGYTEGPGGPVPYRLTISVFPADRNQFVMNSGVAPGDLPGPAEPDSVRPGAAGPADDVPGTMAGPVATKEPDC